MSILLADNRRIELPTQCLETTADLYSAVQTHIHKTAFKDTFQLALNGTGNVIPTDAPLWMYNLKKSIDTQNQVAIYVAVPITMFVKIEGSIVGVSLHTCDAVGRIREQVEDYGHTLPPTRDMYLNDVLLNDHDTIRESKLYEGAFISTDYISVKIQMNNAPQLTMSVSPNRNIDYVKQKVSRESGIPVSCLQFETSNRVLLDQEVIKFCNLRNNTVIECRIMMNLFMQNMSQKQDSYRQLRVSMHATGLELKDMMKHHGIVEDITSCTLTYFGKRIVNGDKLIDQNVQPCSIIQFTLQKMHP